MSLFIEFHLIQNFAPSNLNRDDTGAPKEAVFGGYRRARISSQCIKRVIRQTAQGYMSIEPKYWGVRTERLQHLLREKLIESKRPQEVIDAYIVAMLTAAGFELKEKGPSKTKYGLFLGQQEIADLAGFIDQYWDKLTPLVDNDEAKKSKDAKSALSTQVKKEVQAILDGGKAIDVALFGRMLLNMPQANQEAACQVAHAISTHKVERDFDYFTAVDDNRDAENSNAIFIDHIEFNSAVFYRYAVLDPAKLAANLQKDTDLAIAGIKAFVEANARAIPTGKQNTFAAHNAPGFIGVAVRHASPLNLANALEAPVSPKHGESLSAQSVAKLAAHENEFAAVYGDARDRWAYIDLTGAWSKGEKQANLNALADWVAAQVDSKLER